MLVHVYLPFFFFFFNAAFKAKQISLSELKKSTVREE